MNALEIKNLTKCYKDFQLDNLNLTLPSGCIMGLIGENGAGKSTTIKLILNMIKRNSGEIRILGTDCSDQTNLIKEKIGVVLDDSGLPGCMNLNDIGKMMAGFFQSWRQDVYENLTKTLELPEKKKFDDYSKGMKMKLSIAIALSHDAKLLILDEPTGGLDPVVRDEVVDMLSEFTRDPSHSILISSHIVSDLEKLCDYIAFLHHGKLLLCEEKDALLEKYVFVRGSAEEISRIEKRAIIGHKNTPYGSEAIALRSCIPDGLQTGNVDIEQLFVFMIKNMEARI